MRKGRSCYFKFISGSWLISDWAESDTSDQACLDLEPDLNVNFKMECNLDGKKSITCLWVN